MRYRTSSAGRTAHLTRFHRSPLVPLNADVPGDLFVDGTSREPRPSADSRAITRLACGDRFDERTMRHESERLVDANRHGVVGADVQADGPDTTQVVEHGRRRQAR